jgi:hypothetical protein
MFARARLLLDEIHGAAKAAFGDQLGVLVGHNCERAWRVPNLHKRGTRTGTSGEAESVLALNARVHGRDARTSVAQRIILRTMMWPTSSSHPVVVNLYSRRPKSMTTLRSLPQNRCPGTAELRTSK